MRFLFVLASLVTSQIAFADDVAPRTEPASPETNDADYTNTRFTAGTVVFVASYAAAIGTAASSDHAGADQLYIPIAGPWLALDNWNTCAAGALRCTSSSTDKALLISDGIVQATGLVMVLDGLIDPAQPRLTVADTKLHLAPRFDGVGIWAHF
jgi:hypothetical protein